MGFCQSKQVAPQPPPQKPRTDSCEAVCTSMVRSSQTSGDDVLFSIAERVRLSQFDYVDSNISPTLRERFISDEIKQIRSLPFTFVQDQTNIICPSEHWTSTLLHVRTKERLSKTVQLLWREPGIKRLLAKYISYLFFDVELSLFIVDQFPTHLLESALIFLVALDTQSSFFSHESFEHDINSKISFQQVQNRITQFIISKTISHDLVTFQSFLQVAVDIFRQLQKHKSTIELFTHRIVEYKALNPQESLATPLSLLGPLLIQSMNSQLIIDDANNLGLYSLFAKYNLFSKDTHTYTIPIELNQYKPYTVTFCCGHSLLIHEAKGWFISHRSCFTCKAQGISVQYINYP